MTRSHHWLGFCSILLGFLFATSAFAVGNVQVETTGATSGQVTLVLNDPKGQAVKEDEDSDRRRGIFWWRNRDPGAYSLRTMVDGNSVGSPQTIMVRDNETVRYRVDTTTGVATAIAATMIGRQQQQQNRFWLGGMLGYSYTQSDSSISSPFGMASSGINGGGFSGGLEGLFMPLPRRNGFQPYFAFNVIGDNTSENKAYANFHPTPGLDSGGQFRTRGSASVIAGLRMWFSPQAGIDAGLGLTASRVETGINTNESGGGGVANQFTQTQTLWGPTLGIGIFHDVPLVQGIGSQVFFRAERTWLNGNSDIAGRSTLGFNYMGYTDIKTTDRFLLGLRFALK